MRLLVLTATFGLLAPLAYGQISGEVPPEPNTMAVPAPAPAPQDEMPAQQNSMPIGMPSNTAPDPGNCGTPDEPKPCPPLPRHPLQHYPANR